MNDKAMGKKQKDFVIKVYSERSDLNKFEKASIVNEEFGTKYNESTFRKFFTAWEQGFKDGLKKNSDQGALKRIAKSQNNLMRQQKVNNLQKRDLHKEHRKDALNKLFLDCAKKSLAKLEIKPFKAQKTLKHPNNKGLVMVWGDAQLGREVNLPHNTYNLKIAKARTKAFTKYCIKKANLYKTKDILLLDMGDGIDGNSLRDGHVFALEKGMESIAQQIKELFNLKASIISTLKAKGFNVLFTTVPSNHCRTQANKLKNIPLDDYGLTVDYMLEAVFGSKLELTVVDKTNEWFIINYAGKRFIVAHGDKIKKGMTFLPAHLRNTYPTVKFDYVITAHYHHMLQKEGWLQNGALMGVDDYAAGLGFISRASQSAIVIDGKEINTYVWFNA